MSLDRMETFKQQFNQEIIKFYYNFIILKKQ